MTVTDRVLIDATAVPTNRGGVGRYVDELVPALARLGADVVVAAQPRDRERYGAVAPVEVAPAAVAGRAARMAWEQTGLPVLARRVRAGVVHSPHYTRPLVLPCPSVITLHDATFFTMPDVHDRVKARFFRTATRWAVRTAAGLVVPSAATRDEVLRHAGGRADRFTVVPHGVDPEVFHPASAEERSEVRALLGLDASARYIAFLGTLEPRKNVPALVRAWIRAFATHADPPALVLAGARGWDTEIAELQAQVPAGMRLVVPGYLPIGALRGLLSGASVVAYPSLGEGFGLPVLEAMACGACVLTTRMLSLPEVGGDAVAYAGTDEPGIAVALLALDVDPAERERLGRAALLRAAGFTWERTARLHLEAYAAAAGR